MDEFINLATFGTSGGALVIIGVLVQFTKDLPFTKNIPTQIWSYILTFVVLISVEFFTTGLTLDAAFKILFNAALISMAANGGYSAFKRIGVKNTSPPDGKTGKS